MFKELEDDLSKVRKEVQEQKKIRTSKMIESLLIDLFSQIDDFVITQLQTITN